MKKKTTCLRFWDVINQTLTLNLNKVGKAEIYRNDTKKIDLFCDLTVILELLIIFFLKNAIWDGF